MMYPDLSRSLDTMLEELGKEVDPRLENIKTEEFESVIKTAEESLAKDYQKIEQIKLESLRGAMNDEIVYI